MSLDVTGSAREHLARTELALCFKASWDPSDWDERRRLRLTDTLFFRDADASHCRGLA